MADRDLEAIARELWGGDGTQDAFDDVWRIQEFEQSIAYIGTSVLESLMMEPDRDHLEPLLSRI